jgi:CHASE1-domain containing sensor protein
MTTARSRGRVLRRDRATRWPRALRGAALAVMLVGVLASVWVAKGWQSTVTRQRDERLDRTATARTVTIDSALGGYENALRAARSLWLASDHVSPKDFSRFARSLDREVRYPGLQNINWREVVRDDRAAGFVTAARAEGLDDFTIRPPGRRPVYYVTRYSYPPGSRLGLDARPFRASTPAWTAPATAGRPRSATRSRSTTTLGPRPSVRSPTS